MKKDRRRKKRGPLGGRPQRKGIVKKVLTRKPRKPNSAVRKVLRVDFSDGTFSYVYIPGEGHNYKENDIVLVAGGKVRDIGLTAKVVRRGEHAVSGRQTSRSIYGTKSSESKKTKK